MTNVYIIKIHTPLSTDSYSSNLFLSLHGNQNQKTEVKKWLAGNTGMCKLSYKHNVERTVYILNAHTHTHQLSTGGVLSVEMEDGM